MVTESVKVRRGGLSVAWIDYKKAYDLVPHNWVCKVLESIKAPHYIRRCFDDLIPMWKSQFQLGFGRHALRFDVKFRKGLFQGNSLSPLLFCLCITQLSHAFSSDMDGVRCSPVKNVRITHLLFMDDLKMYAGNSSQLECALYVVNRVPDAMGLDLGLTKCAECHMKKGQVDTEDGGNTSLLRVTMNEN